MDSPPPETTPAPPPVEQKKSSKTSRNLIILGAVAILVILGILYVSQGNEEQAAITATLPPSTALPTGVPSTVAPPTVVPPTPAPQAPYGTSTDYLNIRSGPGTNYPIYGVANPGASSEIVGKSADNAWWAVKIPTSVSADGIGWASADYVTVTGDASNVPVIEAPPPPADVVPPPPPAGSIVVQTTEPVNVRSGPGNEFPSYGKIPAGTPLEARDISADGTWVAVTIPTSIDPSGIGWVSAAYLQPFDPASIP